MKRDIKRDVKFLIDNIEWDIKRKKCIHCGKMNKFRMKTHYIDFDVWSFLDAVFEGIEVTTKAYGRITAEKARERMKRFNVIRSKVKAKKAKGSKNKMKISGAKDPTVAGYRDADKKRL